MRLWRAMENDIRPAGSSRLTRALNTWWRYRSMYLIVRTTTEIEAIRHDELTLRLSGLGSPGKRASSSPSGLQLAIVLVMSHTYFSSHKKSLHLLPSENYSLSQEKAPKHWFNFFLIGDNLDSQRCPAIIESITFKRLSKCVLLVKHHGSPCNSKLYASLFPPLLCDVIWLNLVGA